MKTVTSLFSTTLLTLVCCGGSSSSTGATGASLDTGAILPRLPAQPTRIANTVPHNGDVNPYGVAFVPGNFPSGGKLDGDDILIANFNDKQNLQGTGTTVVQLKEHGNGRPNVFYEDPTAPGFSTALGVLSAGFVVLGNVPSADGSGACSGNMDNVGAGSLMIIDRNGKLVSRLTSDTLLDGPWDLTVVDHGSSALVFVSNVKSGTVTRLDLAIDQGDTPSVTSKTQIASGYTHQCDPAAFVVGPTGLAFDAQDDVLYVAATADNAIYAVANATERTTDAGTGTLVVKDDTHFHGPLGLVRAKNGDLISAQGDAINPDPNHNSELVEVTSTGAFVAELSVDSAPGSAFGLALMQHGDDFRFAAVDDGVNKLDIWIVH